MANPDETFWGIEECLVSHSQTQQFHENNVGRKKLSSIPALGWDGVGLVMSGGYWVNTNQWQLRVTISQEFSDERLDELSQWIEAVTPFVAPGAISKRRPNFPETAGWRVFGIFEHSLSEGESWNLCQREDGVWVVFGSRWGTLRFEGDLAGALRYVRAHHYYNAE